MIRKKRKHRPTSTNQKIWNDFEKIGDEIMTAKKPSPIKTNLELMNFLLLNLLMPEENRFVADSL